MTYHQVDEFSETPRRLQYKLGPTQIPPDPQMSSRSTVCSVLRRNEEDTKMTLDRVSGAYTSCFHYPTLWGRCAEVQQKQDAPFDTIH